MIFGFGKKKYEEEEDEEVQLVTFQGALNGKEANLAANAKLASVGLDPAKELVTDGLLRRAEMIRIDPKGERASITYLIDGVAYRGGRLGKQNAVAITKILKLLSGLDVKERSKPQSGGIKAGFEEQSYELLVDSRPVGGGAERVIIRATNLQESPEVPEDLGIPAEMKSKIREIVSNHQGVILVCGPAGSGVSTTAYGVLRCIDAYLFSIYTMIQKGSRAVPNVSKFELEPDEDFSLTLTRCIRSEAQVVFVDPIRESTMAKTVFSAQEHVTIISEIAAEDTITGIAQLIQWLGDPKLVSNGLRGIVSQKLLRRLCTECREAYRPNPKLVAKIGLPEDTDVLYRKSRRSEIEGRDEEREPCERCGDTGYRGRVGMFEFLEMSDSMRRLIATGPKPAKIKAQARKENMLTLQQAGVQLVGKGITSLEELQRVFKPSSS